MIESLSRRLPVSTLLTGLAAGRCAVGLAGLAQPAQVGRQLGVDRTTAERTAWLARMFAVRDLALGVGLLTALRGSGGKVADAGISAWVRLGVVCDLVDGLSVGTAIAQGHVSKVRGGGLVAVAAGATAIGGLASR